MLLNYVLIFSVTLGVSISQSIEDGIASLPADLQGKVDQNQLNDLRNKSQELFKEKCAKNGGPDAFARSEKATAEFHECVQGLVNTTKLMVEMEEAKPNGNLDEVFKRYCAKTPQFKDCFKSMAEASKPCFSEEEKKNLKIVYNITEQLADFICYKEGDRITLFVAENGPECLQSKQEEIQQCINSTFGSDYKFNPNNVTANSLPQIAFTDKECGQMATLEYCMVDALESCKAPTTANIIQSLFKFIKKATPCVKYEGKTDIKAKAQQSPKVNSASDISVTFATILMSAVAVLLA